MTWFKIQRWLFVLVADLLQMNLYVDWRALVLKRDADRTARLRRRIEKLAGKDRQ